MAYLAPYYDYDLFISYSHGDFNQAGTSPLKQWSDQFVRDLIDELQWNREFKGRLKVYLDQDTRPGHGVDPLSPLPDQIEHAIRRAALLAVLMCEPYLDSKWCAEELRVWLEHHGVELARTDRRIFPIRVAPVADRSWPAGLLDKNGEPLPGFFFHDRLEKNPNIARPFRWKGATHDTNQYQPELMRLVTHLTLRLTELRESLERQERLANNARQLQAGGLVYLHARSRYTASWQDAFRDLDDAGFAVLPPHGPEVEATDDLDWRRKETARVETLIGCDALLLVAGQEEDAIGRDMASVGRHSRHAAKARSDKLLPCAVHDPVGAEARTPGIRKLARQLGIEWIDASAGRDWIGAFQTWLRHASEQLRRTA